MTIEIEINDHLVHKEEFYACPQCGPHVKADGEGGCLHCGASCSVFNTVEHNVRVLGLVKNLFIQFYSYVDVLLLENGFTLDNVNHYSVRHEIHQNRRHVVHVLSHCVPVGRVVLDLETMEIEVTRIDNED